MSLRHSVIADVLFLSAVGSLIIGFVFTETNAQGLVALGGFLGFVFAYNIHSAYRERVDPAWKQFCDGWREDLSERGGA